MGTMRRHSSVQSPEDVEKRNVEKQSRSARRKNFIKEYLVDYTANSNLHGLKYIGEKERTYFEKVFWTVMFTVCVILCAGLIRKVWLKWQESPVIVSFAESPTPVWQIPYPAVTVCFETKTMQTKFNFTEYFNLYMNATTHDNMTEEERNFFQDISLVCDDHLSPPDGRKFSKGIDILNNLKRVMPNMSSVFYECNWQDEVTGCSKLFSPILTEEGHCYTFNILAPQDLFRMENLHTDYPYLEYNKPSDSWTLEGGYKEDTSIETYPHRGLGTGAKAGLTFLLRAKQIDLDYLCKGPVQGFKVSALLMMSDLSKILLHNPAELPRLSQQYFRAPLSQEVVVAVKPKMMTTSDGLKPYEPSRRLCYFPSERYLQYFKVYTQSNCEMECLSNFTSARCGCVHFGMPYSPDMTVCNAGSRQCVKEALMELVTVEVQTGLDTGADGNDTLGSAREIASQCACLPACTSIEYEAETSQANYDWKAMFTANKWSIGKDDEDLLFGRVMIFFKDAQFITSRRSELYGQTDFLANCGGLLGLFMGFSFLSVVEILYFLTLRLCCLYYRRQAAKKRDRKLSMKEGEISIPEAEKSH